MELKEDLVHPATEDSQVKLVRVDKSVFKVALEQQALRDRLVLKVKPVQLALLDRLAW